MKNAARGPLIMANMHLRRLVFPLSILLMVFEIVVLSWLKAYTSYWLSERSSFNKRLSLTLRH